MEDPKALALFQQILKGTLAGKLPWRPTVQTGKFVATLLGNYALELSPATSIKDSTPRVSVRDQKGNSVVEISIEVNGVAEADLRTLEVFVKRIAFQPD